MSSGEVEESLGIGFLGCQARDGINGFCFDFTGFEVFSIALDGDYLLAVGEKDIIIDVVRCPDIADFKTAMAFINGCALRGEKRFRGEGWRYLL